MMPRSFARARLSSFYYALRHARPILKPVRTAVRWRLVATVATLLSLTSRGLHAGTTGGVDMPWNAPLQAVVDNLSGPTGHALVLLAIMISGVIWAFSRHEEGGKKIAQIAVGGSLVLGAASLMASLGFAGAVI